MCFERISLSFICFNINLCLQTTSQKPLDRILLRIYSKRDQIKKIWRYLTVTGKFVFFNSLLSESIKFKKCFAKRSKTKFLVQNIGKKFEYLKDPHFVKDKKEL